MSKERATSDFPAEGDHGVTDGMINVSATGTPSLKVPRHRLANGQFATRPLPHRTPEQINADTGLLMSERATELLQAKAAKDPESSVNCYGTADLSGNRRACTTAAARTAMPDQPAGLVGSAAPGRRPVVLGAANPIPHLFGLGNNDEGTRRHGS